MSRLSISIFFSFCYIGHTVNGSRAPVVEVFECLRLTAGQIQDGQLLVQGQLLMP